ncbi:MarR family winged helix-turn-helix transcriptional regulator [Actinocrispum wychmicini]|uniref:DNA-binding MarR family transcriptional regulator n=1 Tax=Actinocrispum wychmicini TaxID=1213861 RepID=A0A4R2J7Q9_9PSEU|nr:winged helix DNA-binding protein [Actinocrispum wychmicini]TCO52508.1 DNA-binding MarR family transcriptional regulator [Actinocrispum wychmicini]
MDGGQLYRLGRRLVELSRAAAGQSGDLVLTAGQTVVLEDVIKHPGGSVGEIQERTGLVQSHVSVSVAKLRQHGLVRTTADPDDGRKVRVWVTEDTMRAITRRATRGVDESITSAVGDPERARRVIALLDELADLLA